MQPPNDSSGRRGIAAALTAAVLFGVGTPLAKVLLADAGPWVLAALLYLGAGIALFAYRRIQGAVATRLPRAELGWLIATIVSGGIVAPVLLMYGLTRMDASSASLLLNAEGVLTALLAWFVFRENFDRRIAIGMIAIVLGAVVLSGTWTAQSASVWPSLAIVGACLGWAIDNNVTRKLALHDATWLAAIKGIAAGMVNLMLALALGSAWPAPATLVSAMALGALSYGVSLALFIVGLRHLGTARTGAYFSIAPFFGAAIAVLMGDAITVSLLLAAALMGLGTYLHLTERHEHEHTHPGLAHDHEHVHDEHHQHEHDEHTSGSRHRHWHRHDPMTHSHPHYPDAHHRHDHS